MSDYLASGGTAPPVGDGAAALASSQGGGPGASGGVPPQTSDPSPVGTGEAAPAAGVAPPSTPAAGTLATGGTIDAPPVPQTWPEDWRQKLAGEDKGYLKTLERFADPSAFAKAYKDAQTKLSSGALKAAAPGETATPEEMTTWRKENGIPDVATGYVEKLALPNGIVPGEADRPVLDAFAQRMHGKNVAPEVFNEAVSWYYETQDAQAKATAEADTNFKRQSQDSLNKEWGGEFRSNINAVDNLLSQAPDGIKDRLLAGRTADGQLIGNDPAVLKWLTGLSREMNPMASLMPAGTTDPMKGGEARIAEIEGMMKGPDASKLYWNDAKTQEELRSLYTARETMQSRGR